jgi:dinuclear metal center YbgI/SA1388 family protein
MQFVKKMTIKELTKKIEELAPLQLQESYDNAGLIIGEADTIIKGVLISLDVTDDVMQEAIEKGCNLIIAHHPLIFKGLKKLNNNSLVERLVVLAIKNDIAIYAVHTNLDNVRQGVNAMIAEKLGLVNISILAPKDQILKKLVTFCPVDHAEKVRDAIFRAGAGHIGNYDSCSFNIAGEGTFRAMEGAEPFVGEVGQLHAEKEVRIESVFPDYLKNQLVSALLAAHPYEEVAYDIYPIENKFEKVGAGMVGFLKDPENAGDFLIRIKKVFGTGCIRHTKIVKEKISKVALCGGSGSFLLRNAIASGADIFITGDMKYHEFFDADNKIIIADVGHYESEQFTKDLLMNFLNKNNTTFAVQISEVNTNPISYFC